MSSPCPGPRSGRKCALEHFGSARRLAPERAKTRPMQASGLVLRSADRADDLRRPPEHADRALGAEEASTRRRTMAGRTRATCWATKLPMEKPRRSTWLKPMATTNAMASRAICSMVSGVVPVEQAHSGVVECHDPPGRGQRVDQRTQDPSCPGFRGSAGGGPGHLALALAITGTAGVTVGIVDAVGGADSVRSASSEYPSAMTGHPFLLGVLGSGLGDCARPAPGGMPWPSPWPVAGKDPVELPADPAS